MALRINTNVQSLAAQRALSTNYDNQNRSLERLASGNRINKAGDDAAGLAISEKLKAHIRSMKQAYRNAQDGISLVQVSEGAMNEISNILIRLRELSIQGSSDTIGDTERGFINKEVTALKNEVDRIAGSTEFNGRRLLDGSEDNMDIQVGIHNNPFLDRFTYNGKEMATSLKSLKLEDVDTSKKELAQANLDKLDDAITHINESRSAMGAIQNRIQSTMNNLQIYRENLEAANSRIRDTDMAEETAELTKNNILTQSTVSVLGQANNNANSVLKLIGG